jgi:hypothetical protein
VAAPVASASGVLTARERTPSGTFAEGPPSSPCPWALRGRASTRSTTLGRTVRDEPAPRRGSGRPQTDRYHDQPHHRRSREVSYRLFNNSRPRSSADRAPPSGGGGAGSSPAEGADHPCASFPPSPSAQSLMLISRRRVPGWNVAVRSRLSSNRRRSLSGRAAISSPVSSGSSRLAGSDESVSALVDAASRLGAHDAVKRRPIRRRGQDKAGEASDGRLDESVDGAAVAGQHLGLPACALRHGKRHRPRPVHGRQGANGARSRRCRDQDLGRSGRLPPPARPMDPDPGGGEAPQGPTPSSRARRTAPPARRRAVAHCDGPSSRQVVGRREQRLRGPRLSRRRRADFGPAPPLSAADLSLSPRPSLLHPGPITAGRERRESIDGGGSMPAVAPRGGQDDRYSTISWRPLTAAAKAARAASPAVGAELDSS